MYVYRLLALCLILTYGYADAQRCDSGKTFPNQLLKASSMKSQGFDSRQNGARLWPGAEVPFMVDSRMTNSDMEAVAKHLNSISTRTCVRYIPITDCTQTYMQLDSTRDVTMARGMPNSGPANTAANRRYLMEEPGNMAHALLHVLGFVHEEQRADAAKYLDVGRCGFGFGRKQETFLNGLDDFDYSSVMMNIGNRGCTVNATRAPIDANNRIIKSGHKFHGVSDLDIAKINRAYSCA